MKMADFLRREKASNRSVMLFPPFYVSIFVLRVIYSTSASALHVVLTK